MFTTKERVLVTLIGLGALALGFVIAFLPFWTWYTYGWSFEFLAAAGVALFVGLAVTLGS